MSDQTVHSHGAGRIYGRKIDCVLIAIVVMLVGVGVFVPAEFWGVVRDTLTAIGSNGIFIGFAVFMVAYLKASGEEGMVAEAFKGSPVRMVILAAMVGGLAPFFFRVK